LRIPDRGDGEFVQQMRFLEAQLLRYALTSRV
jgi:hypothetical protein